MLYQVPSYVKKNTAKVFAWYAAPLHNNTDLSIIYQPLLNQKQANISKAARKSIYEPPIPAPH